MKKGQKHTLEAKKKMSLQRKGKPCPWISEYRKTHSPWNKGTKGICKSNSGSFKKGAIPWNKSIKLPFTVWNKGKKLPYKPKPWQRGVPKTQEWKEKQSIKIRGEKHPNWQGGKSYEKYPQKFNKILRELIRQRDKYTCQLCGCPQSECLSKLCVHHIDYDKNNCASSNLISLCKPCHNKTNFKHKKWLKYFVEMDTI